jgi:dephospho-CoA kinase
MSYRVGLTGGIGSGKSTVATLFQEHGVAIIDSDAISHQLTRAGGAAIALIRATFGEEYLNADNALSRSKMRQLIFSDPAAKQRLESILHPLIRAQMLAQAQTSLSPYLLLVVPLLFETQDYRELVQRTLVVDCAEETQIAHAMQRSALSKPEVRAIMAQQMPGAERLQLADDVIRNDGSVDDLRQKVAQLHQLYLARSSETTFRPSGNQSRSD